MREYTYLNAGECYLFWDYEDGRQNPKLIIDIIDEIFDSNRYRGSYYLQDFGWDIVRDQETKLDKDYFELICKLERVEIVMNPTIESFLREALSQLFEFNKFLKK